MLPTDTVVEYLLTAPKVVRELQPMHWTFLDGPQDGTVMLTWQPLNHLGTTFSSDGYVWADVEQAFTFEARGYVCLLAISAIAVHLVNGELLLDRRNVAAPQRLPPSQRTCCDPLSQTLSIVAL